MKKGNFSVSGERSRALWALLFILNIRILRYGQSIFNVFVPLCPSAYVHVVMFRRDVCQAGGAACAPQNPRPVPQCATEDPGSHFAPQSGVQLPSHRYNCATGLYSSPHWYL